MGVNVNIDMENKVVTMSLDAFLKYFSASKQLDEKETTVTKNNNLKPAVTFILDKLGICRNIKGFNFLRDAIILCVKNPETAQKITKVLYPTIAKEHKTTPERTERAIRHAIESTWSRGNTEAIDEIFGNTAHYNKGKPANSEFIALIADTLILRMEEAEAV